MPEMVVTAIATTVGLISLIVLQVMARRDAMRAEKIANSTHKLVNSAMAEQLLINSNLSEFKAYTTKDPADIESAKEAKMRYEHHARKQRQIDSKTWD